MTTIAPATVVSAGVVCWRMHRGKLRVLLIRQTGRSDMSFPKGKVDPGESTPRAAVRETLEETGVSVSLGASLGSSSYTLPGGREKLVHYWAAEADDRSVRAASFTPNDEIAEAQWMSPKSARSRLVYERDREILDEFASRAADDTLRTFAIIVLRHGKAVPAGSWSGPDSTRPLEQTGLEQARSSAAMIAAYSPQKLVSSTAARCMSTIEPVATLTGLDIKATAAISQDAYEDGDADVARIVSKRIAKRETAVLCSHGPVLPGILDEIAVQTDSPRGRVRRASALDVGEFAVVHLSAADPGAGVIAIETHSPF